MNQAEQFVEKLTQFESSSALADFLYGQGITGYLGHSSLCPLSALAQRWFPQEDAEAWSIGTQDALLINAISKTAEQAPLPRVAKDFVDNFDSKHYPHLIRA